MHVCMGEESTKLSTQFLKSVEFIKTDRRTNIKQLMFEILICNYHYWNCELISIRNFYFQFELFSLFCSFVQSCSVFALWIGKIWLHLNLLHLVLPRFIFIFFIFSRFNCTYKLIWFSIWSHTSIYGKLARNLTVQFVQCI